MWLRIALGLFLPVQVLTPAIAIEPPTRLSIKDVLPWLPSDTETLIVTNGPVRLLDDGRATDTVGVFRQMPAGLLVRLNRGQLTPLFKSTDVLLAVAANSRFRSPKGLGLAPFDGVQVVQFVDAGAVDAAIQLCMDNADRQLTVEGHEAAVYEQTFEQDVVSLFVARPRKDVLICTTAAKLLSVLLRKMHGRRSLNASRAVPDALPEWRKVDMTARVWGLRHYAKKAPDDPTSPLNTSPAAAVPDSKAIGIAFHIQESPQLAEMWYLTDSDNAVSIVSQGWPKSVDKQRMTIKQPEPHSVHVSYPGSSGKRDTHFILGLLAYLGHAVYQ